MIDRHGVSNTEFAAFVADTEWEFAMRGGLTGAAFPWGDELELPPRGRVPSRARMTPYREAARVGPVFVLAFTAALNPTLLTAVTVMLTLEKPQRLLTGYLAGAAVTSITCGLVLVFAFPHTRTSSTAKRTVNPIQRRARRARSARRVHRRHRS